MKHRPEASLKPSIGDFGERLPNGRARFNVQAGLVDKDTAVLVDRLTGATVHWTPRDDGDVIADAAVLAVALAKLR